MHVCTVIMINTQIQDPHTVGYFSLYFPIIKSLSLTLFQNTLVIHSGNSLPVCTKCHKSLLWPKKRRGVVGAYCGTLYLLFTGFFILLLIENSPLSQITDAQGSWALAWGAVWGCAPTFTVHTRQKDPPPPLPPPSPHGAYFRPWR